MFPQGGHPSLSDSSRSSVSGSEPGLPNIRRIKIAISACLIGGGISSPLFCFVRHGNSFQIELGTYSFKPKEKRAVDFAVVVLTDRVLSIFVWTTDSPGLYFSFSAFYDKHRLKETGIE